MGAIKAGEAFLEFFGDLGPLQKTMQKLKARFKSIGASLMKVGAGFTAAGGAILGALAPSIKAASDMEEVMNKFNVVFGQNANAVKAWSDTFAGEVGRSKKQVAEFMASLQDLFVPLGFQADEATELSKQLTGLAVDLASFNNMADEDVLRDLQAALTGSGEVMKKYGVIVSAAATKQELLNQGLDPTNATEAEKAMARLNIIMRGTTAAQGDALRSAGSFANQNKRLRAELNNAAVAIGSALLPVITPLVTHIATAVNVFGMFAEKNKELVTLVLAAGAALTAVGGILLTVGAAIAGVGTVLGALSTIAGLLFTPAGLLIAGVAAAAAAFLYFSGAGSRAIKGLVKGFKWFYTSMQAVMEGVVAALQTGDLENAAAIMMNGFVATIGKALEQSFRDFVNWSAKVVKAVIAQLRKLPGASQFLPGAAQIDAMAFGANVAFSANLSRIEADTQKRIQYAKRQLALQKMESDNIDKRDKQSADMEQKLKQEVEALKQVSAQTLQPSGIGARVQGSFSAAAASILGRNLRANDPIQRIAVSSATTAQNTSQLVRRKAAIPVK